MNIKKAENLDKRHSGSNKIVIENRFKKIKVEAVETKSRKKD